mmetsp:Transcript_23621/g.71002  ORF Transcript_23621/g.71002 Transcript_23621/m.71002 type:complete len:290 (+) Transcript_23621:82-951(+)
MRRRAAAPSGRRAGGQRRRRRRSQDWPTAGCDRNIKKSETAAYLYHATKYTSRWAVKSRILYGRNIRTCAPADPNSPIKSSCVFFLPMLSGQEERDVRRVFEFLSGVNPRVYARRDKRAAGRRQREGEVQNMEPNVGQAITITGLEQALRFLGRHFTKKQLEYMIWEVDENLDGEVDWDEFKMMYHRSVTDETGLEPFELFNIVQFMTYLPSLSVDKDFTPQITEDDTMSTLFARHGHDETRGRVHVEQLMAKLFGDKLKAEKGEGVLSLDEYLQVVGTRCYARKRSAV